MSVEESKRKEGPEIFQMDFSQFELSEEQKFMFDLKGYLVIPDVFNEDEVQQMKEQVYKMTHEPESLAPQERTVPGGASEVILSNPVVKAALKEFIGPDVRVDNQFVIWRKHGERNAQGPHQGGPMANPHFHYHVTDGRIYSALTRLVVELNPVGKNDGGTIFLPGSHKANFHIPKRLREAREDAYGPEFDRYEASPGSVVIFSENTCHAGPVWTNENHARASIFFAFSNIGCRWHRHHNVAPEVIEGLGPEARWYFRDIWPWDNNDSRGKYGGRNVVLMHEDGKISTSP